MKAFKIGSGECNNYPLVDYIASFGKPIIISTGMNDVNSIKKGIEKNIQPVALKKSKKKETYTICLKVFGMNSTCKKNLTEDQFDLGPAFIQFEDNRSMKRIVIELLN